MAIFMPNNGDQTISSKNYGTKNWNTGGQLRYIIRVMKWICIFSISAYAFMIIQRVTLSKKFYDKIFIHDGYNEFYHDGIGSVGDKVQNAGYEGKFL